MLKYSPTQLQYNNVLNSETSVKSVLASTPVISNTPSISVSIEGGVDSPFKFRESGDVAWLTTGSVDVSNIWKTETSGTANASSYVAFEEKDGKFYAIRWDRTGSTLYDAVLLEMDPDGTVLQSATVEATYTPNMHIYDNSIIVSHTDATRTIGVVSRFDITDFTTVTSAQFLDGSSTASNIQSMDATKYYLSDEEGYIVVYGETDNASPHAVGVITARDLATGSGTFDINYGTTAFDKIKMSTGLSSDAEMILCGEETVTGSKFTTLLYDPTDGFLEGVASEMSHRYSGNNVRSMDYVESEGIFYPVVTKTDTSLAMMKLRQRMGGYSTSIAGVFSDNLNVIGSELFKFYVRFTGVIADGSDTAIAIFTDTAAETYRIYCKSTGELAMKTAGGTEVWATTESIDGKGYESLGYSSDHIISVHRANFAGASTWYVSVNGSAMTVTYSASESISLELGDTVTFPITGVYSELSVTFEGEGVTLPFNNYGDMTDTTLGTCSSTITPAATAYQSYDIYSDDTICQSGESDLLISDGVAYMSAVDVATGASVLHQINLSSLETKTTSTGIAPDLTFRQFSIYDSHIYIALRDTVNANIASIAVMTTDFDFDNYTSIEFRFAPLVDGVYYDRFEDSTEDTWLGLTGTGVSAVDLGDTPYGIVSFGTGHRDYYSFADTPTTQAVKIYTATTSGDYIYDSETSSFVPAPVEGIGNYTLTTVNAPLQEALRDYEAYIDTVNVYYDVNSEKPIDNVVPEAWVRFATSLVKSKLYFAPDSNYTFDSLSDLLTLGEPIEAGSLPQSYSANNDPTYCIASKQIEIKKIPMDGRIEYAVKIRLEAYLGDSGEEQYDDFKIFDVHILPVDSFNIGGDLNA